MLMLVGIWYTMLHRDTSGSANIYRKQNSDNVHIWLGLREFQM